MEPKYSSLRRPKRKLCYLTKKGSPVKQCSESLTLGDVERMFDDLDTSPHDDDDLLAQSPLLKTPDTRNKQHGREASPFPQKRDLVEQSPRYKMGSKKDELQPATRSHSPKLNIDLDIPFKAHMPVKTSSPIEDAAVELENEKDYAVSPILFACEDEGKEKAETEPLPVQEPQCNGHSREESDISEFECPPSKIVFNRPTTPTHKNKVDGSCSKQSHPIKVKTPNKPQTHVSVDKITNRQEPTDPSVSAVRQPKPAKKSENVHRQVVEPTCAGKGTTTFLKMLKDAGQPKPACSRKSTSPVKVPTPPLPEPEEDFLILEEDRPLWFTIPKKRRQSRGSSTDKDSSTDKGKQNSQPETAQKHQEPEQTTDTLKAPPVNLKTKKIKEKKKTTEPENNNDEFPNPEDVPAGDLMEEEKQNKKKQPLKKVASKESQSEEEQPEVKASTNVKMEKKAKKLKSLTDENEKPKINRVKPFKVRGPSKKTQHVDAGKEQSQSSEEPAEDQGSPPAQQIVNSEALTEKDVKEPENGQNNRLPNMSDETSSEDQILGKRKRRQPGQWWLSQSSPEEEKVPDSQLSVKKLKQNNQEPSSAAAHSPVKAKKDKVLKKRNQTQPAPPSRQNKNKANGKPTPQKKNTRGDTQPDEVFQANEAEQEQQDVPDLDVQSSPLILAHRDHSLNSGNQVFVQKVYHHDSSMKLHATPAPVIPRGSREQLRGARSEQRRRKAPTEWWKAGNACEDMESGSAQQQPEPKPKERKKVLKQSRSPQPKTPKKSNMAVSPKPPGGPHVPLGELKLLSNPKSVKRSLAAFKEIFTSVAETPKGVSRMGAGQMSSREFPVCPADQDPAATFIKSDGDVLSMDPCEGSSTQNSPPTQDIPQDSQTLSEDRFLRSGPSSMIPLQQYEEDNLTVMLPSIHSALSTSNLCGPPLKPMVLQPKDKANLAEWFESLWSVSTNKGAVVTPDMFDWYFYQGRAIGIMLDLNCGSFCNGKILLGSYMKKPLLVDHTTTMVFNLLTSTVCVTIDGKESCFNPGQSFMVSPGHAYSIQNVSAQPAVLFFTRMLAENLD